MGTNEDTEFDDGEREQADLGATKNAYKNCRGKILLIPIANVCATMNVNLLGMFSCHNPSTCLFIVLT